MGALRFGRRQQGLIEGRRRLDHGGMRPGSAAVSGGSGGRGGRGCQGYNEALRLDWRCLFCGRGLAPIAAANPHQAVLPIPRAITSILASRLRQVKATLMFHVKQSAKSRYPKAIRRPQWA